MKNIIKGNTDFVIMLFVLSSIGLTYMKIMDVKDFVAMVLMVLSYKFGRSQAVDKPVVNDEQLG